VAIEERTQRIGRPIGLAVFGQPRDLHELIGHLRERRHDDDRRVVAALLRFELMSNDANQTLDCFGIGDGGAAELHDNAHGEPRWSDGSRE